MKTFKDFVKEEKEDPMLTFRKKVDAKRLVPTRSGSKGDGGGAGDGGSGGGGGGGSGGGSGGGGGGGSLEEGNPLARIVKTLKAGGQIGTVSPETGETVTKSQKKTAHKQIQSDLKRLSKKGAVSFTGPHKGRYKYSGTEEPAKEGSYVLKPGTKEGSGKHFEKILKALGSKYKQQSVLKVDKGGEGELKYTGGEAKGTSEPMGKIHYNKPLKTGSGDTQFKGKASSFTVQKD